MTATGLKPLSFRWILMGCIGALVLFQSVDVFLTYRATSLLSRSKRHAIRPLVAPQEDDLLHMNELMTECLTRGDAIVSSRYMQPPLWRESDEKDILAEVMRCPEAEVFLPIGIRSYGYCEDAMAYVKFLETRAMPMWVYEIDFHIDGKMYSYHDLCPHTAVILMNHYWDGLPDRHDFPSTKKLILMPNVEMYDLKASHYHRVDYVLAKTKDAYQRITQWYDRDDHNRRNTSVYYTSHTTSDPTVLAKEAAKVDPVTYSAAPRNWENLTFFHANGHSTLKNTIELLDCWSSRPDFPPISIYSSDAGSNDTYWRHLRDGRPMLNVQYHSGVFARAAGALVLTTDGAPMNEFIDEASGALITGVGARWTGDKVLMGPGTEFNVEHELICDTVDRVLALTPAERSTRAANGQTRYHEQQAYFKAAMAKFRRLLRQELTPGRNATA
ncbi:hypothetical protein DYB34_006485 [Aphanomyces astaci]|uniref:Uncharacterized protein n=1 Tax=Aphanomyces astaci TaxID=112090 RepID=A0A418C043_APHAT|nr:hypothetical protein DYB34_006485 [Aphanomyces astaci]